MLGMIDLTVSNPIRRLVYGRAASSRVFWMTSARFFTNQYQLINSIAPAIHYCMTNIKELQRFRFRSSNNANNGYQTRRICIDMDGNDAMEQGEEDAKRLQYNSSRMHDTGIKREIERITTGVKQFKCLVGSLMMRLDDQRLEQVTQLAVILRPS